MRKYLPYIFFAFLSLAVMLPLYKPGFVFLLDMAITPSENFPVLFPNGSIPSDFPLMAVIKFISLYLPVETIQKAILSLLLFLPSVFMFLLARRKLDTPWAVLSGTIFSFNPWLYERFLAGHWLLLLGYSFFPLLAKYLLDALDSKRKTDMLKFAALFGFFPIFSIHFAYMALLPLAALLAAYIWQNKSGLSAKITYAFLLRLATASLAAALLLNSFWLAGFFRSGSQYSGIGRQDLAAFQTMGDPVWGVIFNILSLYGFWNRDYALPKDIFPLWWGLTFIQLALAALGAYLSFKKKHVLGVASALMFIPALVLSAGYASSLTRPIVNFFYDFLPGFKGLRETEKLVSLLAFSYAALVPWGAKALTGAIANNTLLPKLWVKRTMFVLFLFIPLLSVNNIFFGFGGQLRPASYPESWFEADRMLQADPAAQKVLVLPWWGYLRLPFTGGNLIANPASHFFSTPALIGKDFENPFLELASGDPLSQKIRDLLSGKETFDQNAEFFKSLGISHILLLEEEDAPKYGFLFESAKLKKALESKELVLFSID